MRRTPQRTLAKTLLFGLLVIASLAVALHAWKTIEAPDAFVARTDAAPDPGELRGRAIVHGAAPGPICVALHEHWQSCGKTMCWSALGTLQVTDGWLETAEGTRLNLRPGFVVEPGDPVSSYGLPTTRAAQLRELGAKVQDFDPYSFHDDGNDRIREWCIADGTPVYFSACEEGGATAACTGRAGWTVALGDGTPALARSTHADHAAGVFTIALVLFWVASMLQLARLTPLARALARGDAGSPPSTAVVNFGLPSSVALATFGAMVVLVVRHAESGPSDEWHRASWGYGGERVLLVFGLVSAVSVVLVALRRTTVVRALHRVHGAGLRRLSECSGKVVVFVRAKATEKLTSAIGGESLAFSRGTLSEVVGSGKQARIDVRVPTNDLPERVEVTETDGTGAGVLCMTGASIDVESVKKRPSEKALPAAAQARFGHQVSLGGERWIIQEERIFPGEELLVFGEVFETDVRPGVTGYRSTERVPTLGSKESPLVLFAGKREELEAELVHERRRTALVLSLVLGGLGAALGLLSFLEHV